MAAPFGIGVGDFVVVGKAARELYRRLRESAGEYKQLTTEAKQLSDLLQNFQDLVTRVKLSGPQFSQLVEREKDSQELLEKINRRLDRYQRLGEEKAPYSQRLKWSKTSASDLRSQITAHVSMLQGFYLALSQCAVLDALERVKLNVQAGKSQYTSIATLSEIGTQNGRIEADSEWAEVTRDLEHLGITANMAKIHREMILEYFGTALARAELRYQGGSASLYSFGMAGHDDIARQVTTWLDTSSYTYEISGTPVDRPATVVPETSDIPRRYRHRSAISAVSSSTTFVLDDNEYQRRPWTCIFCGPEFKSKILCRRHLDEQHRSPILYECENCSKRLESKDEMKKQVGECSAQSQWYTVKMPRYPHFYACEYTGLSFNFKQDYVDGLLLLCGSSELLPKPDYHLKLRALLRRPDLIEYVTETSTELFGSPTAWELVTWPDFHLWSAIEDLQEAYVHDGGTMALRIDSLDCHSIPLYLESLFRTGDWDRVFSSSIVPAFS